MKQRLYGTAILPTALILATRVSAAEPAFTAGNGGAQAEPPAEEFRNSITLAVGGVLMHGDEARFQQRHQIPASAFGGIEEFHFEDDLSKKDRLEIDGRALFDNHDYGIRLNVARENVGYIQFGYREFRTWYDGDGGWFPPNDLWMRLYSDQMHIDRGEAWFEAGLRLPDVPRITFRYSHLFRDGEKDSTSWGDTGLTGLTANPIRNLVPAFWQIDEERDIFSLRAEHTIRATELGAGISYEITDHDNARYERRRPGEAQDRAVTQHEAYDSDLFNAHAYSETRLNEQFLFTLGYSFTKIDTDISGSRIYGPGYEAVYDPTFARRQFHDEGFFDLSGGADLYQHVANLNLMWTPLETVTVVPSVRLEVQDQNGTADFIETDVGAPPALAPLRAELVNTSDRYMIDVTEAIEARYHGLTNWVFYTRGEWLAGQGDLTEREVEREPEGDLVAIYRDTDSERFVQKYVIGANWYPLRRLNFGAQYYHKIRDNNYDHLEDTTSNLPGSANRYPAYIVDQDFYTHDINFRTTWRPLINVTLVSRYDFQRSTIDTDQDFLANLQTGESTAHIFSESVSWVPLRWLYLQGSFNLALDETETPANEINDDLRDLVTKSKNNYINLSFLAGFTLDHKTDLQAQYLFYTSDNFIDNSRISMPYGEESTDHGIVGTLTRKFTSRLRGSLRYGWFDHRDYTFGGHNSYEAHLIYSSLQFLF